MNFGYVSNKKQTDFYGFVIFVRQAFCIFFSSFIFKIRKFSWLLRLVEVIRAVELTTKCCPHLEPFEIYLVGGLIGVIKKV